MNILRILLGLVFSLAAEILIVFFVTLGYSLGDFPELGASSMFSVIFALILSPFTAIKLGIWSILAAIAVGGFIGGLASRSPVNGLIAGLLSFVVIFILFLGLTIGFDVNAWITWVVTNGGSIAGDLALCAGIFAGLGAIGGKITSGKE